MHGYLDKPWMLSDLLAAQEKAKVLDSQAILPEGHPVDNPDSAGADTNASESEDEEDTVDSVENDLA